MTNFHIYSLFLLVIPTFSQTKRISDYRKGVIIPKLFRILESNNEIILEKTASEEFDKQGLLDFLQNNANLEYRLNNILHRQSEKSYGAKKRWIKKIVPPGSKTPDVVYDRATGISFKPLVRIHKTKKIELENVSDIPRLESVHNELKALRGTFNAKKSKASLPSIHTYTVEANHLIQHIREVDAIIGQLELPYLKRKMLRMLEDFEKANAPKVEMLHRDILNYIAGQNDIHSLRDGAPNLEDVYNDDDGTIVVVMASDDEESEPQDEPNVLLVPPALLWN